MTPDEVFCGIMQVIRKKRGNLNMIKFIRPPNSDVHEAFMSFDWGVNGLREAVREIDERWGIRKICHIRRTYLGGIDEVYAMFDTTEAFEEYTLGRDRPDLMNLAVWTVDENLELHLELTGGGYADSQYNDIPESIGPYVNKHRYY